jgi:hypothetical protein
MLRVRVYRVLYFPICTFTFNYQTATDNIVGTLNVPNYMLPSQLDQEFELRWKRWCLPLFTFPRSPIRLQVLNSLIPSGLNACMKNLKNKYQEWKLEMRCSVDKSFELQTEPFQFTTTTN